MSSKDRRSPLRKVAFASPHCLVDFTSGAAIATARALQLLSEDGFACQAFCGSYLDAPEEGLLQQLLAEQGVPNETRTARIAGRDARLIFTRQGDVPVTVFETASTRGGWADTREPQAFFKAYETFLAKNRPDAVVTYGGDGVSQAMMNLTRRHDIPVIFWLHNFAYPRAEAFALADYVVVPSEFSRQYHGRTLRLACHVLPNVIDPRNVVADNPQPRYVAFVNPQPAKGLYVFARIAEQLARRRPEIPLLVVEGRGQTRLLAQTGLDFSFATNLHAMPNTPDPRRFYRQTRLILMPSLCDESFGLVAAEALANGIPVLASDRGALPETLGESGLLFSIPTRYQPQTRTIPTAEEVQPWIDAIVRLWDNADEYHQASRAARARARQWRPDRLRGLYADFFQNVFPQPAPPFLP